MFLRKIIVNLFCFSIINSACTYIGPGIYHNVAKGESLWDISKAYNVKVNKIVIANRYLKDPDHVKPGQKIYIPNARYVKKIPKSSLNFIWPVKGKIIQRFGRIGNKRHLGIGIKSKEHTPILAAETGKVIFTSENFRSYGKTIIIEHNKYYATVYAHNSVNCVKNKQIIKRGEKIAEVGKTGWAAVPYLYFEIRYKEKPRNPLFMLP
jgi:murein DD-endopeptidase MepM/ murein hydrolase activator NlpD